MRHVHLWIHILPRERKRKITIEWPTSSSWVGGATYSPIFGVIMGIACCKFACSSAHFPSFHKRKTFISFRAYEHVVQKQTENSQLLKYNSIREKTAIDCQDNQESCYGTLAIAMLVKRVQFNTTQKFDLLNVLLSMSQWNLPWQYISYTFKSFKSHDFNFKYIYEVNFMPWKLTHYFKIL